jgi:hypothetical protein
LTFLDSIIEVLSIFIHGLLVFIDGQLLLFQPLLVG